MSPRPRLRVNPIACEAHGLCAELLPELIRLDDWGYPMIVHPEVPDDLVGLARRAVDVCPTLALLLERGDNAAGHRWPRRPGLRSPRRPFTMFSPFRPCKPPIGELLCRYFTDRKISMRHVHLNIFTSRATTVPAATFACPEIAGAMGLDTALVVRCARW